MDKYTEKKALRVSNDHTAAVAYSLHILNRSKIKNFREKRLLRKKKDIDQEPDFLAGSPSVLSRYVANNKLCTHTVANNKPCVHRDAPPTVLHYAFYRRSFRKKDG